MKYIKTFEQLYWGTEGAGLVGFCSETKRFLIGLRSGEVIEPNECWGTFGGKFDDTSESASEVSIREFDEETRYNGEIETIEGYIFEVPNFKYHNFIGVIPNEFEPVLNWENSDFKWLTLNELIQIEPKHPGLKLFLEHSIDIFKNLVK